MARCEVKFERRAFGWDVAVLSDPDSGALAELHPHRGALLSRFELAGAPVLYLDESTLGDERKNVRGGVPILFPIAGKLPAGTFLHDGRSFALSQHGFARNLPWRVVGCEAGASAAVTCALSSSPETLAQFPFPFSAELLFRLQGRTLRIELQLQNPGAAPLPLHYGLHPYFFVPDAAKAEADVATDGTTAFDNRTGQTAPFRGFDLAADELDLHLLDHRRPGTTLRRPPLPPIELAWDPDFGVLVVWTVKGKDYVCVEPWTAPGGALATGARLLSVPPGATRKLGLSIAVGGAAAPGLR